MLFGRPRKEKVENVAAATNLPRPPAHQTVIHQAPSEMGRIFAQGLVYLVGAVVAWYFILHLIEATGDKNPERTAAFILFGLAVLVILTRLLSPLLTAIRDTVVQVVEINASAKVEMARLSAQAAALPLPGESRLTEEDSKFCALLRVVMDEAYNHLYSDPDEVRQYGHGEQKPWSRRANAGRMIPGFKEPVTEQMASRVSSWLMDKGVIDKKGIVDVSGRGYPSLAHFVTLLEREYYTPIQVQRSPSPTLQRDGYRFTEE